MTSDKVAFECNLEVRRCNPAFFIYSSRNLLTETKNLFMGSGGAQHENGGTNAGVLWKSLHC